MQAASDHGLGMEVYAAGVFGHQLRGLGVGVEDVTHLLVRGAWVALGAPGCFSRGERGRQGCLVSYVLYCPVPQQQLVFARRGPLPECMPHEYQLYKSPPVPPAPHPGSQMFDGASKNNPGRAGFGYALFDVFTCVRHRRGHSCAGTC